MRSFVYTLGFAWVPPLFANDGASTSVVLALRSLILAVNGDVAVDAVRRPEPTHLAPDDGHRLTKPGPLLVCLCHHSDPCAGDYRRHARQCQRAVKFLGRGSGDLRVQQALGNGGNATSLEPRNRQVIFVRLEAVER